MRQLRLKKKLLTMVTFVYVAVLAASITYAAVSGLIIFSGEATTQADLEVIINALGVKEGVPSLYDSKVVMQTIDTDGKFMTFDVILNAPGDMAYLTFDFINTGTLPAEFEEPMIEIDEVDMLVDDPANPGTQILSKVSPVIIEDFAAAVGTIIGGDTLTDAILGFEDIDGYVVWGGATTDKFGMAFVWDEDVHYETVTPLQFKVEFPYIIAEIN